MPEEDQPGDLNVYFNSKALVLKHVVYLSGENKEVDKDKDVKSFFF